MGNCISSSVTSLKQHAAARRVSAKLQHFCGQNYDDLAGACRRRRVLFEDPMFPADIRSIGNCGVAESEILWLRPHEICQQFGLQPIFTNGGTSRFDLIQGELGNCWVLASTAALAEHPALLDVVVPPRQTFEPRRGYAGVFKFRFYHFGQWHEVIIDDRLPTRRGQLMMLRSSRPNLFWGSLLEKAYAKLHGSYEALRGGRSGDCLSELTAGIVETYRLRDETPVGFNVLLFKAIKRGSLVCAGIYGNGPGGEQLLPNGLVAGHAYTVSDVELMPPRFGGATLIRVRNPWGDKVEWNGPWSDRSEVWRNLPIEVSKALGYRLRDDGEFWMEMNDFLINFDDVDICNLTPDSLFDSTCKTWNTTVFSGSWLAGKTAGGRIQYDSFAANPHYLITLPEPDIDGDFASAVIELSQDRHANEGLINIGFTVYEAVAPGGPAATPFSFYTVEPSKSITTRLDVPPGSYVVVPTAEEPNQEGNFILRIWTEQKHSALMGRSPEMGVLKHAEPSVKPPIYETTRKTKRATDEQSVLSVRSHDTAEIIFRRFCTQEEEINPFGLQKAVRLIANADFGDVQFSSECCKALVAFMDKSDRHTLTLKQFLIVYKFLKLWLRIFISCDKGQQGSLNISEFATALQVSGQKLTGELLDLVHYRYGDINERIQLSPFIECLAKLQVANEVYLDLQDGGSMSVALSEFLIYFMKV